MAEECPCFPELYSPDLTGYVLTSRLGGGGAAGEVTLTQRSKRDNCGQEGIQTPSSPPEEVRDRHVPNNESLTPPLGEETSRPFRKELIPLKRLALEDFPHSLQTEDNWNLILEMSERMALVHTAKPCHEQDGTRMQRPDVSSPTVTLGFIYTLRVIRAGFEAVVVTSPEVLPTTEAVERSTLEVALDRQADLRAESMPGRPLPSWSTTADTKEAESTTAITSDTNSTTATTNETDSTTTTTKNMASTITTTEKTDSTTATPTKKDSTTATTSETDSTTATSTKKDSTATTTRETDSTTAKTNETDSPPSTTNDTNSTTTTSRETDSTSAKISETASTTSTTNDTNSSTATSKKIASSKKTDSAKFAIAAYCFGLNNRLYKLSFSRSRGYHPHLQSPVISSGDAGREKMVCVLSWTRAEGKCVSFGQVVEEEETLGEIKHDAPVPPECLGSLVVVFSSHNSFWLAKGRGDQRGGVAVKVDWKEVQKAALLLQGFIPIPDLTVELLPEEIRSKENLELIQETSKLVVKINVNTISEERPVGDPFKGFKSMTGSGIITEGPESQDLNVLTVFTNQHVLYDSIETMSSTIDINFEKSSSQQPPLRKQKRTARLRGIQLSSHKDQDQCTATYLVKEQDMSVIEWPKLPRDPNTFMYQVPLGKAHDWVTTRVVAVVSHPMGEPKQVSFGNMFVMPDLGVRYDAPTLPGSSGAPIIIFEKDPNIFPDLLLCYHEGKCSKSGFNKFHCVKRLVIDCQDKGKQCIDLPLVQFVPIFADFLLHPGDHGSSLRESALGVCDAPSVQELSDSIRNSPSARERLREIVRLAPSLFPDSSQGESDDVSSLLDLMTSGMPCRCRSIVLAVTGSKSPDAEVFSTTHAAPPDFNPDRPWPWSHDFSHDAPCSEERCLLRAVLAASEWAKDPWPFLALLVLVLNASRVATHLESLPLEKRRTQTSRSRAPEETPNTRPSSGSQDAEVKCQPSNDGREGVMSSEGDPPGVVEAQTIASTEHSSSQVDRSELMSLVIHSLGYMTYHLGTLVGEGYHMDREFPAGCQQAVARWRHLRQHTSSIKLPLVHRKRRDPDLKTICPCGAPTIAELSTAFGNVFLALEYIKKGKPEEPSPFQASQGTKHDTHVSFCLINTFPGQWDTQDDFRQGRDALSSAISSLEVYFFNCRALLRRLQRDLHDLYLSRPVSVFSRPGNWPGNVTPPQVRDTAWRLIQEAFTEVGVNPALLCDLEQDADTREKLIDLYVDMKQLKFQGRLDRSLLIPEHAHRMTPFVEHFRSRLGGGLFIGTQTSGIVFYYLLLLQDKWKWPLMKKATPLST